MKVDLSADFFQQAFRRQSADLAIEIEEALLDSVEEVAVVATRTLDLSEYTRLGHCETELLECPRPIQSKYWGGEEHDALFDSFEQSFWRVRWQDTELLVLTANIPTSCGSDERHWVLAASEDAANAFILDVARKTNDPGESILVFRNGYWSRSHSLYQTVSQSGFDDLVLQSELVETLRTDFRHFLGAREEYETLGLAWRRGALLVGPPGNGKTHCVRALINELEIPCLYVQSLAHHYYGSEQLLQQVFERARELRPCVLVFEDLDALVDEENQSFFLNQLDGFEKNVGLIVLATTNHPERIDAAIIDRPSRFDRKYHFPLPSEQLRLEFLLQWQPRLATKAEWSDESVRRLANSADGFSFAYLKELVVSGLLAWLADSSQSFDSHLDRQLAHLAVQMRTSSETPVRRRRRRRRQAH